MTSPIQHTCRRHLAAQTLTLYLAGELSPERARAVQAHLVSCPLCARACEDQRLAQRLMRSLTMERPLPLELDMRIRRSLEPGACVARGASSLRFLRSTRPATRGSGVHSAAVGPRGAFPGVSVVLGVALLLVVGLAGIGGLPALSLPVSGSGLSHPSTIASPSPHAPSSGANDSGYFYSGGGSGHQQLR